MDKRQFLTATALAGAAVPALALPSPKTSRTPTLLTVSGAIEAPNRGPSSPVFDQMMHKQKVSFTKARAFDFFALTGLPVYKMQPTLEYDNKAHQLNGPALLDVLKAARARLGDNGKVVLRAVDGYAVTLTVPELRKRNFIVATHLDGHPMALGGLGPLWAVFDADRDPEMAAKPVNERFGNCPWALYHIEVL